MNDRRGLRSDHDIVGDIHGGGADAPPERVKIRLPVVAAALTVPLARLHQAPERIPGERLNAIGLAGGCQPYTLGDLAVAVEGVRRGIRRVVGEGDRGIGHKQTAGMRRHGRQLVWSRRQIQRCPPLTAVGSHNSGRNRVTIEQGCDGGFAVDLSVSRAMRHAIRGLDDAGEGVSDPRP